MGEAKRRAKAQISRHEWSALLYRKGELTREGHFKKWQDARLWIINHLRTDSPPTITLATVCHVERVAGKVEDVDVIKFIPRGMLGMDKLVWTEIVREKPWFGITAH